MRVGEDRRVVGTIERFGGSTRAQIDRIRSLS
jgi:hypothetical protein